MVTIETLPIWSQKKEVSAWSIRTAPSFPHLSVADNITFGLKLRKESAV